MSPRRRPVEERFWEKVSPEPNTGCWLWTAAVTRAGYGVLGSGGRHGVVYAHRLSYEMRHGVEIEELHVCHRCDTPPCVNPAHLFLGEPADNMADMTAKGRRSEGERHRSAKLTALDVIRIRHLLSLNFSQKDIAAAFGISRTNVSAIMTQRSWRQG